MFRRSSSEGILAPQPRADGRRPSMMRRAQQGFAGQGRGVKASLASSKYGL